MAGEDYRSNRMPSPEGRGIARAAWERYSRTVERVLGPPLRPAIENASAAAVADAIGFYVLWHLMGGFAGLQELGMSRSAIYRRVALCRSLFGQHPDEMEFPGVDIDVKAYQAYVAKERRKLASAGQ